MHVDGRGRAPQDPGMHNPGLDQIRRDGESFIGCVNTRLYCELGQYIQNEIGRTTLTQFFAHLNYNN